ncbi:MAG: glycosyl hydrolase, partial [Bacillota bacterium]
SYSNIRAVLKNNNLTIEVYRQAIEKTTGAGIESYVNYSNQFINNRIDHKREMTGKIRINERSVSFLQWSRRSLNNIKNDKCYYASVEVPLSEQEVLTFLFKSNEKYIKRNYLDVIRSLQIIEKTEAPYERKIQQVKNPSWNDKTASAYDEYFGEESKLRWGIFETGAPVNFTALKEIEEKVNYTFPILLYYTGILENKEMHPKLAIALQNAKMENRMLELTLQTVAQTPGKGNMVYDVLDGKYDIYLKNYANEVVKYGEPILFRLGNEMNGDWCVYSSHHTSKDTEIFKAFYRYIYQIFADEGAENVIWVWNPNGKAFPDFKWNDELCYYPGDEYVDVIGMTSYNTGTYYEGETWTEFDSVYDSLYEKYIDRYEKPLMITEFSSSSVGGNKEAWVSNMFRHIDRYDRIKVAVWWDGCDWDAEGNIARSYFIDETEGLVQIFRENLAKYKWN